jgi:hypothetical protein
MAPALPAAKKGPGEEAPSLRKRARVFSGVVEEGTRREGTRPIPFEDLEDFFSVTEEMVSRAVSEEEQGMPSRRRVCTVSGKRRGWVTRIEVLAMDRQDSLFSGLFSTRSALIAAQA